MFRKSKFDISNTEDIKQANEVEPKVETKKYPIDNVYYGICSGYTEVDAGISFSYCRVDMFLLKSSIYSDVKDQKVKFLTGKFKGSIQEVEIEFDGDGSRTLKVLANNGEPCGYRIKKGYNYHSSDSVVFVDETEINDFISEMNSEAKRKAFERGLNKNKISNILEVEFAEEE